MRSNCPTLSSGRWTSFRPCSSRGCAERTQRPARWRSLTEQPGEYQPDWGEGALAKFATFFTLKGETIAAFLEKPSDRAAAVRKLLEPLGGKLESYYWMFGPHDGFIVCEM